MSKFARRSSVKRAASGVSGQRQQLSTITRTSTNTMPTNQVAYTYSSRYVITGIAAMQRTKNAHTTVWMIFTATKAL